MCENFWVLVKERASPKSTPLVRAQKCSGTLFSSLSHKQRIDSLSLSLKKKKRNLYKPCHVPPNHMTLIHSFHLSQIFALIYHSSRFLLFVLFVLFFLCVSVFVNGFVLFAKDTSN